MTDGPFPDESAYRPCPACGEPIRREAVICRYCRTDLRTWGASPGTEGSSTWPGTSTWPGGTQAPPYGGPGTPPDAPAPAYGPTGPYTAPPSPPRTNSYAIASLVLGIVNMLVGSILALVFGYRAMREIDASQGTQTGRGFAVAGVVLGWVGLASGVIWVVLFVLFFLHGGALGI